MSISKTDIIDLITKSGKTGICSLIIVADEPWEDSDNFMYLLQKKLSNYRTYFLDGQMRAEYPDCKESQIVIRISSTTKISEYALRFISKLKPAFQSCGIDIETELLP